MYVLKSLKYKTNGTFIDIGCSTPKYISNTYLLETQYSWRGIGIDIEELTETNGDSWSQLRPNTALIIQDALNIDYIKLFQLHNMPKIIDYLSLDLEPPELTLQCLFKIPFHEYKFRIITFETDAYRDSGNTRTQISRKYLQDLGYKFDKEINRQDDLYFYPFI